MFAPSTLYNVSLLTSEGFQSARLCVRTLLDITRFSVQKLSTATPIFASSCGEGMYFGNDAFDDDRHAIFNNSSLPTKYRVQQEPERVIDYLVTSTHDVQATNNDIRIDYLGYTQATINQRIVIVPTSADLDAQLDASQFSANRSVSVTLSEQELNNPDPITSVTYVWGDGNRETVFTTTPISHTYAQAGNYNITIEVQRASGSSRHSNIHRGYRSCDTPATTKPHCHSRIRANKP